MARSWVQCLRGRPAGVRMSARFERPLVTRAPHWAPGVAGGVRVWEVVSRNGGHEWGDRRRRALILPILPIRVAYLHPSSVLWGSERSFVSILRDLDRETFEPVVVLTGPGPLDAAVRSEAVERHLL